MAGLNAYNGVGWLQRFLCQCICSCHPDLAINTGKKEMEREIVALEDQFPDSARGVAEFSTPLAHQIIAGQSDTS